MSFLQEPITELEAINNILELGGFHPVSNLEESTSLDVQKARRCLHIVSREVQNFGYDFNSDEEYALTPNADDNYIYIPKNALVVDPCDRYVDAVIRSGKLYDRKNHTFTWDGPVKVDIVWFLPFEDLPQSARNYINIRAARVFILKVFGQTEEYSSTAAEEIQALVVFKKEHINTADLTMNDSEPGFSISWRCY